MERRVVFSGRLFPALLLMPQLAVTIVFFFWPAAQAILQSVLRQDAFGLSTRFVGGANFTAIFADPYYLASVEVTLCLQRCGGGAGAGAGAVVRGDGRPRRARRHHLQDGADAALRDRAGDRRGVVDVSVQSEHRRRRLGIASARRRLEFSTERAPSLAAGDPRRGVEADRLQFPVLSRRAAGDPEIPDRGRGDRRREADAPAVLDGSSFRCWRRPASFCSSSTSSMRSSTRSASSTT